MSRISEIFPDELKLLMRDPAAAGIVRTILCATLRVRIPDEVPITPAGLDEYFSDPGHWSDHMSECISRNSDGRFTADLIWVGIGIPGYDSAIIEPERNPEQDNMIERLVDFGDGTNIAYDYAANRFIINTGVEVEYTAIEEHRRYCKGLANTGVAILPETLEALRNWANLAEADRERVAESVWYAVHDGLELNAEYNYDTYETFDNYYRDTLETVDFELTGTDLPRDGVIGALNRIAAELQDN